MESGQIVSSSSSNAVATRSPFVAGFDAKFVVAALQVLHECVAIALVAASL
jgi:hypothetical protein